ncbi:hypothetical protein HDU93_006484 [Gonapodya sp. JEL0774]|nr:hypothetical protein HDU93_006484 [Gonapodya sp. JEL0774]
MAETLGIIPSEILDHHRWEERSGCHLRFMEYKPERNIHDEADDPNRIQEHTDIGTLTLLFAQPVAGLKILQPDGVWRYVKPADYGAIVCNGNLQHIKFEIKDEIALVSLNRPRYRNTIARRTVFELDSVLTLLGNDDAVKVIVLRAEGDHFSSGHDLGTPDHKADELTKRLEGQGFRGEYEKWSSNDVEAILRMRQVPKPMKGYVIFHGTAIMSACDIVIAADNVKIMPTLPASPTEISEVVQANTLPYDLNLNTRKYREIVMSKRFILGDEAEQIGYVNRIVPLDLLDEECWKCAKVIAKSDPFQLRMIKVACNGVNGVLWLLVVRSFLNVTPLTMRNLQAQDAAGYTSHVRASLSAYGTSRAGANDPLSTLNYKAGIESKSLAPIPSAESPDLMYWSKTAVSENAGKRIGKL